MGYAEASEALGPSGGDFIGETVDGSAVLEIVYQVVDTRTSAVVQQFPEEAVLRRRAYFRALDLTNGAPTRALATDRKA